MMEKFLYRLFLFFVKFMQILPKGLRRGFFFLLARIVYLFASKTNRIIKTNLNFAFPNRFSEEEIKEIQKYSYFNMTLWILSLIENLNVSDEELKENVKIENEEVIYKLKEEGKPIILISAHFGNMEMMSTYMNKFITPIVQVARESNFSAFDDFIVKSRESSGSKIVFKKGALKKLISSLMKKEVISLIIDQNVSYKDASVVKLFDRDVYQTNSPSLLARKFDAYIVPLAIFNEDNYKYKIKIYDPIAPIKTENEKNDIQELSQLQANAISAIIRENPKLWFWPHKRFKGHYKEIYEKNFNNK